MLHFIVRGIRESVYFILGLLTVNATVDDSTFLNYWQIALLALALYILAGAFLRYFFYSFRVLEDGIQVKQGVLFKKQLDLNFKRIQNVNIRHPIYFRPLKLVMLKIDGAGSKNEEVNIAALTLESAKAIRKTVQIKKGQLSPEASNDGSHINNEDDANAAAALGEEEPFYTRSFRDLVIHGLTNNRAWIIVGGIIGFLQSTPFSISDAVDILQELLGTIISNESVAYTVMLFSISFVLAVVLTALLSVVGSIVAYYGFTLYTSDKSIMVHRGLINKQEINMQKSRVQSVYFRQDWLDLILRRVNVIYEQITHMQHDVGTVENSKKILVPSAREWERSKLIQEIFDIPDVATLQFQRISKRHFYKISIIWSVIYVIIAIALTMNDELSILAAIVALWSVHIFLLYMNWLRAGLAMEGDYVIVRKGIIGIDYIIFPAHKLQVVDHVQSLLMRRRNLSDIVFHTASRTAKVPYLPTQFVKDILNYCVYSVESDKRSWM